MNTKELNLREFKNLYIDFRDYKSLKELLKEIHYRNMSIDDEEKEQEEYMVAFNALVKYRRRIFDYLTERKNLLNNAKNFYDGREMIINAFKEKIFPLNDEDGYFEDEGVHRGDEDEDEDDLDDLN